MKARGALHNTKMVVGGCMYVRGEGSSGRESKEEGVCCLCKVGFGGLVGEAWVLAKT